MAKICPVVNVTQPPRVLIDGRYVAGASYLDDDVEISPGRTPLFDDRALALAMLEQARERKQRAHELLKAAQKREAAARSELRTEGARHALAAEIAHHWEVLLELEPEQPTDSSVEAEADDADDGLPAELAEPDLARAKPGEPRVEPDGGRPDALDGI